MSDFEKGLMLAGYITPNSISELVEKEELERHEATLKEGTKNLYFKRVVLAAEIVSKLHAEPSLGRVKFQKLVYLCEHVCHMNLEDRYVKQAAGPFDNKFMHSIGQEFSKNKWFSIEREQGENKFGYRFIPLENASLYKRYYLNYFENIDDKIQYIIELFRKQKTDYTELATTVFACVLELSEKSEKINQQELLNLFYDWSKEKQRFTPKEVLASYDWLQEKGLITI